MGPIDRIFLISGDFIFGSFHPNPGLIPELSDDSDFEEEELQLLDEKDYT